MKQPRTLSDLMTALRITPVTINANISRVHIGGVNYDINLSRDEWRIAKSKTWHKGMVPMLRAIISEANTDSRSYVDLLNQIGEVSKNLWHTQEKLEQVSGRLIFCQLGIAIFVVIAIITLVKSVHMI